MIDYPSAMNEILRISLETRRAELAEYVSRETKRIVQSGPFQGMVLPERASWGSGDITAKLLGMYEQELHPAIERAISRRPEVVFNVGSAEGYYAVGFKLRLRMFETQVIAVDTSQEAHDVCIGACKLNGVNCLHWKSLNGFDYSTSATDVPALIFMDVEGAEREYLSEEFIVGLKLCDVIVECHDFMDATITDTLRERFKKTHFAELIRPGPRNPATSKLLAALNTFDQSLAINEFRPLAMHWLAFWSNR